MTEYNKEIYYLHLLWVILILINEIRYKIIELRKRFREREKLKAFIQGGSPGQLASWGVYDLNRGTPGIACNSSKSRSLARMLASRG